MVNICKLLLLVLIIISCGARNKIVNKSTEESKNETRDISKIDIKKDNDIIINKKSEINTKELEFSITPLIVDNSTEGENEVTIIDENGKQTKIKYPKNSNINIGSKSEQKTETESKEDKSKEEVNIDSDKKESNYDKKENKDSKLNREEPYSFNIGLVILIFIIITIIGLYIYLKIKPIKRNTK